jgi:adenine-specific DNA-methyltransferase
MARARAKSRSPTRDRAITAAEEATTSAGEATTSAGEATTSAGEDTIAAGEATIAAGEAITATHISSEDELASLALALGARDVAGWSTAESALEASLRPARPSRRLARDTREAIMAGADPLSDAFGVLRTARERRPLGATYTPGEIVAAMVLWAQSSGQPARVVDPGAGSGRFAVAAGRAFPRARIVAVEVDPLAAMLARAHLAAAGLAQRSRVIASDYRAFRADGIAGQTLYLGNPPYVRHHQIDTGWKHWLSATAAARGLPASQLAGMHVHFFLATAAHAAPGDYGAFVTSAEWLDVNYGALVRGLVLDGLGGEEIHLLDPTAMPFSDAATTAAITCFRIGAKPRTVKMRRVKSVAELGSLGTGRALRRERLAAAARWTQLTGPDRKRREGYVQLGEICSVHRGTATGANATWIVQPGWDGLPARMLVASVTRARELFDAMTVLAESQRLRRVIEIPAELDGLEPGERLQVERFLRQAKRAGVAEGYIARHRRAWWSVQLRPPAPILATYMARRPPAFVRNAVAARHVNIAHGLYPREPLSEQVLEALAAHLRESVTLDCGRTYAGGLTKFEPGEMERLPVPDPAALEASTASTRRLARAKPKRAAAGADQWLDQPDLFEPGG